MKSILLPLLMALIMAVPAFAEWELGLGWTPNQNTNNISEPNVANSILSFHVGYTWHILYFSWDAPAMPHYWATI